jgi:hypothetical protein
MRTQHTIDITILMGRMPVMGLSAVVTMGMRMDLGTSTVMSMERVMSLMWKVV